MVIQSVLFGADSIDSAMPPDDSRGDRERNTGIKA